MKRNKEVRTYQDDIRKRLGRGEAISQEETSILVDQFMIDQSRESIRKPRPKSKHKHRWTKPYFMSTVGRVKACKAPGCPKRMKAVKP
jgi:hypothetical protein